MGYYLDCVLNAKIVRVLLKAKVDKRIWPSECSHKMKYFISFCICNRNTKSVMSYSYMRVLVVVLLLLNFIYYHSLIVYFYVYFRFQFKSDSNDNNFGCLESLKANTSCIHKLASHLISWPSVCRFHSKAVRQTQTVKTV